MGDELNVFHSPGVYHVKRGLADGKMHMEIK